MKTRDEVVAVFSGGGTGGHLYPALTLAEALRALRPDLRAYFVGAERGVEARVLPERRLEHTLLTVEGFRRDRPWANLPVLRALLRALLELGRLFRRLRPHLVVVTGGYASGPAGLMAAMMRIRLVVQEQNAVPGLTSRALSLWAREIHLAFPEARDRLPRPARRRVRISGNPVRPPTGLGRREAAGRFGLDPHAFIVLVVGGSQGSQALNRVMLEVAKEVAAGRLSQAARLEILWATGPAHEESVVRELSDAGAPKWIRATGYIEEIPDALATADLAVSRAGAMATSEFLAWGIPAILVPLPTAAADHQSRNADALAAAGAAIHLSEDHLTPEVLWNEIIRLARDRFRLDAMAAAARERGRPDAASEIAQALARHLPPAAGLEEGQGS